MANYSNLKAAIAAAIKTNGNQEITGQVLQDVLNSIVSVIGANYTFAGVATPSTNPGTPDQNLTYLAMEGGTYTNFNGTVLPAGISLLMWNGTWMSETVMYGDGGVFDISVYKSSGGTLATFADLSAALDGGNNIPASARKGGMSVKFVQSSDNKYIQYRLIATSFSTTESDWQKQGAEVTVSQNSQTGDDTLLADATELGNFADAYKLIQFTGFGAGMVPAGASAIGDVYFNTTSKVFKKVTGLNPDTTEVVPFYKGAIYTCNNELYIWNGTDLVNKTERDAQPTKDSHKLVESGGVFGQILAVEVTAKQNLVNMNTLPILEDEFIDNEEQKSTSLISLPSFDNNGNNTGHDSNKNWFSTDIDSYYHIKGTATISNAESLIASFSAYPSPETFISSYGTYVPAGTYNIDCIVKAKSVRMTLSNGLSVYKIMQNNILTKRIVNHISVPTNDNSTSSIRIINSVIPKGAKITEFSFKPRQAGTTKMYLFKYENEIMTVMEILDVTASGISTTTISTMVGRTFDYDCFVGFVNTTGVTGCVGFDRNYRSQLSTPLSGVGIVGSTFDFNLVSSTVGCPCMKVSYSFTALNDNLSTNIIRVGAGKECLTIQDAVNRAIDGDSVIVYPGQYNERVQAWGKYISIIGINKNSCILIDDRADYRTPPLEMSVGYVANITIKETAENPIIDSSVLVNNQFPALNMAYCIHSECGDNGNGKNLVIDDCILWNANRPCVGAGLYDNQGLEIRNTVMYSGMGVVEGYHRGAIYVHAKESGANNQRLIVSKCEVNSDDDYSMYLRGYSGGSMSCILYQNMVWNSVNGKADSTIYNNFGTGITLHNSSFGNNVAVLNAQ